MEQAEIHWFSIWIGFIFHGGLVGECQEMHRKHGLARPNTELHSFPDPVYH